MSDYDQAWLISDTIKAFIIFCQMIFSMAQIFGTKTVRSKKRIQWLTLIMIVVFFVFNLGAHDPVFFGWEAFLVFQLLTNTITLVTVLYLTYEIAKANYVAVNLKTRIPWWTKRVYSIVCIGCIVCNGISRIVVLSNGSSQANSVRLFVNSLVAIYIGVYLTYSFLSLRRQIINTYDNLLRSLTPSGSGKRKKTNSNPNLASEHPRVAISIPNPNPTSNPNPNAPSNPNPNPNNLSSPNMITSNISINSKPNPTPTPTPIDLKSPPSPFHSSRSPNPKSGSSMPQEIGEKTEVKLGKPGSRKKAEKKQRARARRVLNKITAMTLYVPIIASLIAAALLYLGVSQATERRTYGETIQHERRNYSAVADVIEYVFIILIGIFLHYSYQSFGRFTLKNACDDVWSITGR